MIAILPALMTDRALSQGVFASSAISAGTHVFDLKEANSDTPHGESTLTTQLCPWKGRFGRDSGGNDFRSCATFGRRVSYHRRFACIDKVRDRGSEFWPFDDGQGRLYVHMHSGRGRAGITHTTLFCSFHCR